MSETGEISAVVYNQKKPPLEDVVQNGDGADIFVENNQCNSARPFLKKGSGLVRYYKGHAPKQFKRKSKPVTSDQGENEAVILDIDDDGNQGHNGDACQKDVEDDELKMFEALEKATVAASFCSTSSLAARFLQSKCNMMRKNGEKQEMFLEADEGPSDLCSLPSSLFGSDYEDDEEEEDEEGEEIEESIYIAERSLQESRRSNILPTITHGSTAAIATSKDFDLLVQENTSLKARIVYLEEKMEKNTLEWWSHKEQMVQIVHSLQSTISKRDKQLENIQDSLTKKLENLEEELRLKSQKWSQCQINLVEKNKLLEEELQLKKEQQTLMRNKMQKSIDMLSKEIREKASECILAREHFENRISTLESSLKQRDAMQPRKVTPKSITFSEHMKEPAETVDDNIFGVEEEETEEGMTKILPNGDKETVYPNGTRKVVTHNLSEMKHFYTNGDIRILKRDGTVKYLYAESGTWQTSYTNGVEYYEFANGQVERRNPNGVVEIVFTNGCVKYAHPSGTEECIFADNTILRVDPGGERSVVLPNGQQEIYGSDYKKRIYPDGTVKTVYSDGTQETRYPNGRVRIKDKQGVLLADISDSSKHSGEIAT